MSDLKSDFAARKWFHAIDFGDFASSGRFRPGQAQNITLYGFMDMVRDIDLTGMRVLDIGAVDGLASFGMKALGATDVVATDSVVKDTFLRGKEVLGLDITYHPKTQIKDFPGLFGPGSFDAVLCAGVIYHMFNPVSAFLECRKIIREGGLLFMETPYFAGEERACIFVNSETEMVNEIYTYSVPTKAAVLGLMKLAGFEILAVRTIKGPDRITVLGRATALNEIADRTPLLQRIHELDTCDFEFRYAKYVPSPVQSTIRYTGPGDDQLIDYRTYVPLFPYHPPRDKEAVGTTMWMSPTGNH
jgi:2-polyprenyl-3-methyl-5-hydroxy-6-metoxy-1,4-benzoquinol methylase